MTPWRFIPLLDAPGSVQMALDTWLLQQQALGHPPTLRFYTWNPPAISLGRSQRKRIPTHWHSLTWQGQPLELVERPSGGRGVLHQGDLTYAIATRQPNTNLAIGYRTLCEFLMVGWAELGVHLRFGEPDRAYMKSENCFGLATNADLIDDFGRKFIGSAQRCTNGWVLQHGAMLLNPDPDLFQQVFGQEPPQVLASLENPILQQSGQDPVSLIMETLMAAAASCFEAEFEVKPLTQEEWAAVEALAAEVGS